MSKTIMYCPLNDGHIIAEIHDFAQKAFEERVDGFRRLYGTIKLEGTDDFQKMICTLPVVDILNSDILVFDKVVADYDHKNRLDVFWKKHQMELQKPDVSKSNLRELFFVAAALMQLKTHWNKKHDAQKYGYTIHEKDSWNKKPFDVRGYCLKKVGIALKNDEEVSALIDLGNDVDIRLSDIAAFGSKKLQISNERELYEMIVAADMRYLYNGYLYAPCIEEKCRVKDHLMGVYWTSRDLLYQVYIESSEALTKLKLSEKGVEARAETVAQARMLIGCSVHNVSRTYSLTITHGLVVDIRYKKQSIFVAYVPQYRFIKA